MKKNLDSLSNVALLSIEDIEHIIGRPVKSSVWDGSQAAAQAQKCASMLDSYSINCILHDDEAFPALLRECFNPPYMLFYRGNLKVLQNPCVSVVGTRRLCRQCASDCFSFARQAALNGMTVVSGLASGADAFAHRGALEAFEQTQNGSTAAVLPCGMDTVVPHGHVGLAKRIIQSGGVLLSEYLPGVFPEPWRFVQRNRIIAGLSPATVVVQAPPASGALITADFALEYNRDLMFMKSGFCEDAMNISRKARLHLDCPSNGQAKKKSYNTSERFLEEGAPVIENYADFVKARAEAPGGHICKNNGQLSLF